MKHKLITALIALSAVIATTSQAATQIWTGGGDGVDIDAAANWGGTVPNSANGDIGEWNGTPSGNLFLTHNTAGNLNNGTPGDNFYLTGSQTGSVNISSRVASSANVALNATTIDSGGGAFSLGDGSANVLNIILRPSSSGNPVPIHTNLNNSANTAVIYPNVRYQSGGGNPHSIQFDGTGNWVVSNALNNANSDNNNNFIRKFGSGTMFWNPNSIAGAAGVNGIGSPIIIQGGALVLTASATELNTQRITNNGTFQYNAAAAQTLSGPFDGVGNLVVSAGTLTLSSSQSDWTGNIFLTNGGVLVPGSAQNVGGTGPLGTNVTIFFNGGTLQFSVANTFDYSPNFSTAINQAFSFNTAGQNVTFTNVLASSGGTLTKLGSGTLTLAGANTYDGATTISAGTMEIQGAQGSGSITVGNSTTLGVSENGAQLTPATLTVGTTSSATLEFNNVSSTTTPAIAVTGAITTGGRITVNIASGSFLIGQHYPLFSWGSGTPPPVALGTLTGAVGNLSTNGNSIQLNITGLAFVWTGAAGDGFWDTTSVNDWKQNGVSAVFANGSQALLDDTATGTTNINMNADVSPASVSVNSSVIPYSIASSPGFIIDGIGGLTKSGNSTLTLSGGVNNYTGPTIINGGTISVTSLTSGGSPSDIGSADNTAASLVFNGGKLRYATGYGAVSDHLFTLGTGGGTLDDESSSQLWMNNTGLIVMSGTGARTLTLTGNGSDEFDSVLSDNGGATSLGKSGSGTWILGGNNTNSGTVTITAGTLQVGNGGASGAIGSGNIVDNGTLDFATTSTLTNGAVTGTGQVKVDGGGTVILPGNNTYSGATTINTGTLQIGNGGASGSMNNANSVTVNDTFIDNSTTTLILNPGIAGSGNVIVRKGTLQALGNNSYTGWTEIDPGATFQPCLGNVGAIASSVITNNGTITFGRQDNNVFTNSAPIVGSGSLRTLANNGNDGDVTLTGSNSYTGGTFIGDNILILGDGVTPGSGAITGNVQFVNNTLTVDDNPRYITFNRVDNFIFNGNITTNFTSAQNNLGIVKQIGTGTLTLTGTNTYGSGTVISNGVLQVGNGGTSGTIGSGAVTDGSILVWDRSDAVSFNSGISGSGSLVQLGSGTLTLANTTYTGTTAVSNGTLVVNGSNTGSSTYVTNGTLGGNGTFSGPVTLDLATKLAPSVAGATINTLTINGGLSIGANLAFNVNKSLAQSNDLVSVSGVLTNTGTGTLTVSNLGPALAVGDKFTVFSQAVSNGAALTVVGGGALSWANNLAVDGSITVLTTATPPAPVAGFSGTPTNGFAPLSVTFTDASTGTITNWVWTFGDGSSVTNTSNASQGHSYAVGTNTVSLVVNGPGGSSTNTRAGYVAAVSAKVVFSSSSNPSSFGSGKFGFSGTGGPAGVQYRVLTQTNVAQPLANWTPIYTNTFKSDGSYAYTNSTLIGNQGYLILVSP